MKKYIVIALVIIVATSMLTMTVSAAGIMAGLESLDAQIRNAAAIICGILAVVVGLWTFVQTRSKPKSLGVIIFFCVLWAFAKSPEIISSWGSEIAGWF